jgi:hypothetical protein
MIKHTEQVTITAYKRLHNSPNGNPRFAITYRHHWSDPMVSATANTAADHSFAYEIGNRGYRVGSKVWLTIGGRGTIIAVTAVGQ